MDIVKNSVTSLLSHLNL
uniref:Uncharacterized protein n=1 Tax=Arundo donax TaxID=35708 RepID=A0A0A9SS83_ARUDO